MTSIARDASSLVANTNTVWPTKLRPGLNDCRAATDFVVGVKECDEYVANYTRCVEAQKEPTVREQFRESLRSTVQSWRDVLAQSGKELEIAAQCKAASDAMKQSAASMGCTWCSPRVLAARGVALARHPPRRVDDRPALVSRSRGDPRPSRLPTRGRGPACR